VRLLTGHLLSHAAQRVLERRRCRRVRRERAGGHVVVVGWRWDHVTGSAGLRLVDGDEERKWNAATGRVKSGQLERLVGRLALHLVAPVLKPDLHLHTDRTRGSIKVISRKNGQLIDLSLKFCNQSPVD